MAAWYEKASVQTAIITGIFLVIVTFVVQCSEAKEQRNRADGLEEERDQLRHETQRLETQLAPFRAAADKRFPDHTDSLAKLGDEIGRLQERVEEQEERSAQLDSQQEDQSRRLDLLERELERLSTENPDAVAPETLQSIYGDSWQIAYVEEDGVAPGPKALSPVKLDWSNAKVLAADSETITIQLPDIQFVADGGPEINFVATTTQVPRDRNSVVKLFRMGDTSLQVRVLINGPNGIVVCVGTRSIRKEDAEKDERAA